MTLESHLQPRVGLLETFQASFPYLLQDAVMKARPTPRTEIRWMALAVPAVFVAHWLLSGLVVELLRLVPESVRAIFHLL